MPKAAEGLVAPSRKAKGVAHGGGKGGAGMVRKIERYRLDRFTRLRAQEWDY